MAGVLVVVVVVVGAKAPLRLGGRERMLLGTSAAPASMRPQRRTVDPRLSQLSVFFFSLSFSLFFAILSLKFYWGGHWGVQCLIRGALNNVNKGYLNMKYFHFASR